MAEALRNLLIGPEGQHFKGRGDQQERDVDQKTSETTGLSYLVHLAGQPLDLVSSYESQQLLAASHSLLLSIQSLSKKQHKPVIDSSTSHASLPHVLPILSGRVAELSATIPKLDVEAELFSTGFNKASENPLLARRRQLLRLLQNSERLVDVMELPPLLNSSLSTNPVNYPATLDLYIHIRRFASLYPESTLIGTILSEADSSIRQMAADLITALRAPTVKLAAAVRTVGWLRRLIPDIALGSASEDVLPALFLVCRLMTLLSTLNVLEPLRELADNEQLRQNDKTGRSWAEGQQTERYLKRFIEVFREHSFNILSLYKSVNTSFAFESIDDAEADPLSPLPSSLSTLPLHLADMLMETLRIYLPAVKDQVSRESILTQVLYCASSLGRLGADFGMLVSMLGTGTWVDLIKRHRQLAGRLESVIGDYRGQQHSVID